VAKPLPIASRDFPESVLGSRLPVLVEFATSRCPACHRLEPILSRLADEYEGRVTFGRVDVEENPDLGDLFQIRAVPTIVLFKDSEAVDGAIGAPSAAAVRSLINANLGCGAPRQSGLG